MARATAEALRDYLLRHFRTVYSGYEVTDVEIGMAADAPVTIALRRLARERAGRLAVSCAARSIAPQWSSSTTRSSTTSAPMASAGLLYTITRHGTMLPKVRYNPHDEGRRPSRRRPARPPRLAGHHPGGPGPRRPPPPDPDAVPAACSAARTTAGSVIEANACPEDIADAIYTDASVAGRILSWQLSVREERPGETRPQVDVRLVRDDPDDTFRDRLAGLLTDHLRRTNGDYREAFGEYPELLQVLVGHSAPRRGPRRPHRVVPHQVPLRRQGLKRAGLLPVLAERHDGPVDLEV